jgi:arsenite-transporting ATPase
MPPAIAGLPRDILALKATNMIGVEALSTLFSPASMTAGAGAPPPPDLPDAALARLVGEILRAEHGLVMCMGKGGVGKTTIAAAIAVALAQAGREVHLTTTDPAAHLTETLHGTVAGLQVSRIDPATAVQAYRDHVMATKGKGLDEAGRAVLAEDLLSPCTEEIAVFQQFSRVLSESRRQFVVVDTAPTGHTLLLLDATGSYHREVARHMGDSMNFTTPLMRLQDPAQTKVILVTLAETTPVLEAQGLQEDLERAGIHPWAWVINNSISAARPEGPFLRQRAASEAGPIQRVSALADRIALVSLRATEPTGEKRLAALANLTRQPA